MLIIPLLLSVVLSATPASAEEPVAERKLETWRVPLTSAMHEQFAPATDIVYYVILGDLDKVKAKGVALAALDRPEMPDAMVPAYDRMKKAAADVATSPDLDTAAERAVALGGTCAACHTAHGGPTVRVDEVTGDGWWGTSAMEKHQEAAYMMWLGTMLPSEVVFHEGRRKLSHGAAMPPLPKGTEAMEVRVHEMAAKASVASDEKARADALVDFLQTCAACHVAAKVDFSL